MPLNACFGDLRAKVIVSLIETEHGEIDDESFVVRKSINTHSQHGQCAGHVAIRLTRGRK